MMKTTFSRITTSLFCLAFGAFMNAPTYAQDDITGAQAAATPHNEAAEATVDTRAPDTDTTEADTETESTTATAETYNTSNITSFTCSHNEAIRVVSVNYSAAPATLPCEVLYDKQSEDPNNIQTLYSANNTEGYCEEKAAEFAQKLTGWGWSCQ